MALVKVPVDPTVLPESFNFATDIVDYWATKSPSRIALHWIDQSLEIEKKLTYNHFAKISHAVANLLKSIGVAKGDTCIIILPRLPEWWEMAAGCLRAGVILCPCTTLLVAKDIEYRLQISKAKVFVGDEVSVSKVLAVRESCPDLRKIIQIGPKPVIGQGVTSYESALSEIPLDAIFTTPALKPSSPALIFFTSGTTGPPKMVLHSQTSYPLAHALTGIHWLKLDSSSVYWNLSEQGWAKAAWAFFATWNCGATLFVHDDREAFAPQRTLEVLTKFPITTLCAPPTAYRQLILDKNHKYFQHPGMKTLVHACGAGEPLNDSVIQKWKELTNGMEIYDGYGQTETILICANQAGNPIKPGSMGKPIPGVPLVVIDLDGHVVPDDTEGDIAIEIQPNSPQSFYGVFQGYIRTGTNDLDQRIKTSDTGKQYYLTGDRATRDRDGYIKFVGRNDDVINSSGYRIGEMPP